MTNLGLIGLGVMGENLARNMTAHGLRPVVFDTEPGRTERVAVATGALVGKDLAHLVSLVSPPRRLILMVPAGPGIDGIMSDLLLRLDPGDIIADCGNSHFLDTRRRAGECAAVGVHFVGVGLSGGAEGALRGAAVMAGGEPAAWQDLRPILEPLAARHDGQPCCGWVGGDGAGHLVKTVHNGIEYAIMQVLAEAWDLLRLAGNSPREAAAHFRGWATAETGSFLLGITAEVLDLVESDGGPLIEKVVDQAGQKGTGRWAVAIAHDLGVVVPTLAAAVDARLLSSRKAERVALSRNLAGPDGAVRLDPVALGAAVEAATLASYHQGIGLIAAASARWGWGVDCGSVVRLWRAGCIIRSRVLDPLADDVARAGPLLCPAHSWSCGVLAACQDGWRRTAAAAALAGIATPAVASSLSWYDSLRRADGPAGLIQLQRDRFGGHGFARTDRPGLHHIDG